MRARTPLTSLTALLVATSLSGCGAVSFGNDSSGGDYPNDTIEIVVGTSAGGPTDTNARILASCLEGELGETVVIKNVDGASGAMGNREIISAEPDGYSLSLTPSTGLTLSPYLDDLDFGVDDVNALGMLFRTAMIFAVPPDAPYQTGEELMAYAKANPGQVKVGTPGPTSPKSVVMDALRQSGVDMEPVPLEGQSGVTTAALGGNVDVAAIEATDDVKSAIETGKLVPVAAISTGLPGWLPAIPTLEELGHPDAMLPDNTYPLYGPQGLPGDVVSTIEDGMEACVEDDEVVDTIGEDYVSTPFEGADDTTAALEEGAKTYEEIVQ